MKRIWTPLLVATVAALGVPAAAQAADTANGKTVYTTNCVSCHGEKGDGKGPVGAALNPPPRDFSKGEFKFDTDKDGTSGSDADLIAVIKNGAAAYGGSPLMAPWGHLSDSDIADVVAYVHSLKQ